MTKTIRIETKSSVLDFLEQTAERRRYSTAVTDGQQSLLWYELTVMAKRIGSGITRFVPPGNPVPVMMEKSPLTLAVMLGAVYAGCFYVPVNPDNPPERLEKIFRTLDPEIIITDRKTQGYLTSEISEITEMYGNRSVLAEELLKEDVQADRLFEIREKAQETDILYGLFTSGSTGTPKAVVVSHGAVIRFITHFTEIFKITGEDVIGNQAPFDFDVSVKDIYSSLMTGAELALIPKEYFSTPPRLLDYICGKKVTTLIWAVSALTLVSALKGLDYRVPEAVNKVMFSGEAMPPKQLRIWQEALPDASFVNLYGPTEITCNCTYYPVERKFGDEEKIPAGKAFPGRRVFLLDEHDREIVVPEQTGEICVSGESLAEGYYNNREQTEKHFVMFPVSGGKPERTYRTGDMGYYDRAGELVFAGRKDFQIKHMGHRIELEEIESAMNAVEGVTRSCCIFDREKNRICGFYMGDAQPPEVRRSMKRKVPSYMIPSRLSRVESMPLNRNGKTDRERLRLLAVRENGERPDRLSVKEKKMEGS